MRIPGPTITPRLPTRSAAYVFNSTPKNWSNLHQYSIAYGGPIKIPGVYDGTSKTFFYALWDQNIRNTRDSVNVNVMTDTARQGIFRYWQGYNPLGWNPAGTLASPTFPLQATTASFIAVDQRGNPLRPPADPDFDDHRIPGQPGFIPYSGNLICFSVFGTRRLDDRRQHGSVHGRRLPGRHHQRADGPRGVGCVSHQLSIRAG